MSHTVQIDLLPIDHLEQLYPQVLAVLPEDRRRRIGQLARPGDRLRSAAGSLLIACACRGRTVSRGPYGKPFCNGICFNISHSGRAAVLARAEAGIGIDIEAPRALPDTLAERILSPEELVWYHAGNVEILLSEIRTGESGEALLPGVQADEADEVYSFDVQAGKPHGIYSSDVHGDVLPDRTQGEPAPAPAAHTDADEKARRLRFLWTRKEALSKCLGTGFHTPGFPEMLPALPGADGTVLFQGQTYSLESFEWEEHMISAALSGASVQLHLRVRRPEELLAELTAAGSA